MPSLDYEAEKEAFLIFYDASRNTMEASKSALITLIRSLLATNSAIAGAKLEARVKEQEECLSKFRRKYRPLLESEKIPYSIRDHITDLIGIRIVCFYEDEVDQIRDLISEEFEVIEVTNKSAQMEESENAFGYKGLHMDLRFTEARRGMREYAAYAKLPFELQIRTVVQDSWSVLDHKIKYKKSIPNHLKRRINTLAALFELADREFRAVRDGTIDEIAGNEAYAVIEAETVAVEPQQPSIVPDEERPRNFTPLDAFSLHRIARHFFHQDFEPHKIDGFTDEILRIEPSISRGKFNYYLRDNISEVRRFKAHFEQQQGTESMNAFTVMRHCLYASDKNLYISILTSRARETFDNWLARS